MPLLGLEQLETAVVDAVKTTLEAQFGFCVQSAATNRAPGNLFWRNTILHATIELQGASVKVGLQLFVAGKTVSLCMQPLMGCELALDDSCVLECPGEFLNVTAGLLRKQLNSQLKLELDMTCAENKGTVSMADFETHYTINDERRVLFLFETNYGEVLLEFWSDTIKVTKNRLAS